MALAVHAEITAAGNAIKGESSVESLDRADTIECLEFLDGVRTAREAATGVATGERSYEPIRFRKKIDCASPLLAKALCNNETVEAKFRFFRPNPAGDGTTEHFYTIELAEGRVSSIERHSPSVIDPASSNEPATEMVGLVFGKISWTYEPGGQMHTDEWRQRA